jgi:hypothetical protein
MTDDASTRSTSDGRNTIEEQLGERGVFDLLRTGRRREEPAGDFTMADQHDDATRPILLPGPVDDRRRSRVDLVARHQRGRRTPIEGGGEAWGVGFTIDGEPADGFHFYSIDRLPVLSSEESGEPPIEEPTIPLTKEEVVTWRWLIDRGVPSGLSAEEMADDFGITTDIAALRLASITVLGLAHEVSSGRYRAGEKDA